MFTAAFASMIFCLYGAVVFFFFFFNDTATTEIYTLSLHDALPICARQAQQRRPVGRRQLRVRDDTAPRDRSEEHTSEPQSRLHLVCRLLLEKKKKAFKILHNLSNDVTTLITYDVSTHLTFTHAIIL